MKHGFTITFWCLCVAAACGATLTTETFTGSDESWVARDVFMGVSYDGIGGLRGEFSDQGMFPAPETDAFRATGASSGGNFAGDYTLVGATQINFDLLAETVLPSDVTLRLSDGVNTFFYPLVIGAMSVGNPAAFNVPLVYASGWIGAGAAAFNNALTAVSFVEVQVTRNGGGQQFYTLDNFELNGDPISGGGGGAVPEPGSGALFMWAVTLYYARHKRLRFHKRPVMFRP